MAKRPAILAKDLKISAKKPLAFRFLAIFLPHIFLNTTLSCNFVIIKTLVCYSFTHATAAAVQVPFQCVFANIALMEMVGAV
jgi:hypothetical protein